MNSPEENAVRDLDQFTSNVLNGMLDMHRTAADLIRYSFHVRTIKDVVRRGSENPELVNQIADSLNHMVIYLNEEIVVYARKANQAGLEERHFKELLKRMSLLYEIWVAMCLREEYQDRELMKHVDASKEAIKITYEMCKDFPRWDELALPLQEFFLGCKRAVKSTVDDVEPTLFAREDGVVTSLAHEQAQSDEDGKKKQFVAKTEKVLNNYRAKNPDYKTMRELINAKTPFRLDDAYADNLINDFIIVWDWANDHQTDKLSDKYLFTALFKKVFMLMNDKRRNNLAKSLFDKYEDSNGVLPCLENFIENFQSGLTDALNKLPLDPSVLNNQPSVFEECKEQLQWYLVVSPSTTLLQLLNMGVDNRGYVPLITRICRSLNALFVRSVRVTPLAHETGEKDKLLITMLNRVFTTGRSSWTASQWENASFMAMSFAKIRKRNGVISDAPEDRALLDSFSLIQFALKGVETPRIVEKEPWLPPLETFVQMLQRLLANNNNARMLSNYSFATSVMQRTYEEKTVDTVCLVKKMYNLLHHYDGKSKILCDCAREILKSVGGRMENDGAVFNADTRKYLEESFNEAGWWIKYAIFTWFGTALSKPKRQVPSGIYQVLTDDQRDDFEQIKSEQVSTVAECYLKSLFELGLFDVDLAIDLLHIGHNVKFGGSNVVEMMALALVDSFGKRLSKRGGGLEIEKLIKEMLKIIDPIRDLVALKTYNTSYLECTKKIEHILVLLIAARIAREKKISAARVNTNEIRHTSYDELLSLDEVADQLMDVFCETAKAHIEHEVSELATLRETAQNLIFNTPGVSSGQINIMIEKEEREQSLVLQLTILYLKSSHFTRLYQDVPIKLKQLMNVTLDKQFDSQKLLANRVMDDVLTEQRKSEVVYVFAEPPEEEQKKSMKEPVEIKETPDVIIPQKPNTYHEDAESTSAENTMFAFNGGESHQGKSHPYGQRMNNSRRNYPNHFEYDRQTSSRGVVKYDRNPPNSAYRSRRWSAVHDTQTLAPRHREAFHSKTKYPLNIDYERRNEPRRPYDQDRICYEDRRSPFTPDDTRRSDDVRRYSDSRDSCYEHSWENASPRRWPSESDYSHDDSENRVFDKTLRSVHSFSKRDALSTRPSGSEFPSPQIVAEGKSKKGFGSEHNNRYPGQPRKPTDWKPREFPSFGFDHQEEGKKMLRPGNPDREEIANAFGYSDRSHSQKPRRGGHHFQ